MPCPSIAYWDMILFRKFDIVDRLMRGCPSAHAPGSYPFLGCFNSPVSAVSFFDAGSA